MLLFGGRSQRTAVVSKWSVKPSAVQATIVVSTTGENWEFRLNQSVQFSQNVFTEFAEFSDKKNQNQKRRIAGLEPRISCVKDRDYHSATEPQATEQFNSCFSDFSDSLNSMKVPLHLGKTPLACLHAISAS